MSSNLRSSVIRLAHANPELRPHLLPLLTKVAADKQPKPKFKSGDIVQRDDGSSPGTEVESSGDWDDFLKTYRYQVRENGRRVWWNETSMVKGKTASAADTQITRLAAISAVVLDEMMRNQTKWDWLEGLDRTQLDNLAGIIAKALAKSTKNHKQQLRGLGVAPTGTTMSEKLIRAYTPAQSRQYAPLVRPFRLAHANP